MWKFEDEKEGIEIVGTKADIVKELNIHMVFNEQTQEEELVDIDRPSHWKRIVEDYHLTEIDD